MAKTATFITVGNPARPRNRIPIKYQDDEMRRDFDRAAWQINKGEIELSYMAQRFAEMYDISYELSRQMLKTAMANRKINHKNPARLSEIAKCKRLLESDVNDDITFSNRDRIEFDVRNPKRGYSPFNRKETIKRYKIAVKELKTYPRNMDLIDEIVRYGNFLGYGEAKINRDLGLRTDAEHIIQ